MHLISKLILAVVTLALILGGCLAVDKKESDNSIRNLITNKELAKVYQILLNNMRDQYLDGSPFN